MGDPLIDSRSTKPRTVLAWVVVALLAGAVGGLAAAPGEWYNSLNKPAWNPPSWIFGPVWTTLYILMGIAAALAWEGRRTRAGRVAFLLFGLQLALNALWSWLFFHWHRPDLALADLVVLWVVILGALIAFRRIRPLAGWLLVPYLAWVSFAGVLNASIAKRNPGERPLSVAGPLSQGVAVADCAPYDGPATSIFLSESSDIDTLPPAPPYLQLIIYEPGARLSARRVEFGRVEGGSGIALRCQPGGECATTNRGTVEFGAPQEDGSLLGSYRLTFSGDTVAGTFRARWSSRVAICG
jgi:benzodiazapine receptor